MVRSFLFAKMKCAEGNSMNRENKTVSNVPTMEIEIQGNKATLCFAENPPRRQQSESSRLYSMSSIKQICGAVKDKYTLHQGV